MIITKKALPRRTFLKGAADRSGAAAARCDDPRGDRLGADAGEAGAAARLRVHPDGMRSLAVDAARRGEADPAVADTALARAGERPGHGHHQHAASELLSGHARHVELGVPERGLLEAHRELGLLPRHDDGSDCGQADGPRHAAAVARAVDGPEPARGRVQQRIRLRLSELPVVVVADDPAAVRSASAHRLRAPVRRRRQRGGAARGAAWPGEPARFVQHRHRAAQAAAWACPIACASISISTAFARSSGRSSAPRPVRWTTRCPTSIARSASPRRSRITRSSCSTCRFLRSRRTSRG